MLLIIDTNKEADSIFNLEFVKPIEDVCKLQNQELTTIHFKEFSTINLPDFNKLIICGNPLQDFEYLEHINLFQNIKEYKNPLLGICAGMQILALTHGATLEENIEIGPKQLEITEYDSLLENINEIYCLHKKATTIPEQFKQIAKTKNSIQAIKHQTLNQYGLLFHPEVNNKIIIERFLNL